MQPHFVAISHDGNIVWVLADTLPHPLDIVFSEEITPASVAIALQRAFILPPKSVIVVGTTGNGTAGWDGFDMLNFTRELKGPVTTQVTEADALAVITGNQNAAYVLYINGTEHWFVPGEHMLTSVPVVTEEYDVASMCEPDHPWFSARVNCSLRRIARLYPHVAGAVIWSSTGFGPLVAEVTNDDWRLGIPPESNLKTVTVVHEPHAALTGAIAAAQLHRESEQAKVQDTQPQDE